MPGARLELTRESGHWVDSARAYRLFVDEMQVGTIKRGETHSYDVEPGRRQVQLRVDWCRSPTLEVEVDFDQPARLICRPNAKFYNLIFMIIFRHDQYIALAPAPSA